MKHLFAAAALLLSVSASAQLQVARESESPLAKARKTEVAEVGAAQTISQTLYAARTPATIFVNPKDVEAMPDGYKPEDLEREDLTYRMNSRSRKITVVKGSELNRGETVSWSGVSTEDGKWFQVETRGLAGWVRAEDLSAPGREGWTPEIATAFATRPAPEDGRRTAFVKEAASHLGDNYVWGGRAPGGFDCSGLVQYSMDVVWPGNKVPRVSREQQSAAKPVGSAAELKTGDLVFTGDPVKHVMIFVEDGELVEAMGRKWGVRRSELNGRISGKPHSFGTYFEQ